MDYIERNLVAGESVVYKTRLHWVVMSWLLLEAMIAGAVGLVMCSEGFEASESSDAHDGLIIAGLLCLALAGILIVAGIIRRRATEIAVSNKRVLIKRGLVSHQSIEVLLPKVESITVHESVFGRMLGYGDVILRGTGGTFETFARIARPDEFRRQVQQQASAAEAR